MLDTPTSANVDAFRQRYCQGYGYVLTEDKKTLVYLKEIRGGSLSFQDDAGHRYSAVLDAGVQFEFLPIMKGWAEGNGVALFVTRVPAKQYSRAITQGNTAMYAYYPTENFMDSVGLSAARLEAILEYKHDIHKAMKAFNTGKQKYAVLSKHFALLGNRAFFHNEEIGQVKLRPDGSTQIQLSNRIVEQELRDLLNRTAVEKVSIE